MHLKESTYKLPTTPSLEMNKIEQRLTMQMQKHFFVR